MPNVLLQRGNDWCLSTSWREYSSFDLVSLSYAVMQSLKTDTILPTPMNPWPKQHVKGLNSNYKLDAILAALK